MALAAAYKFNMREILKEFGRRNCLQQVWHSFQEILGTFPKEILCVRSAGNTAAVGGHTVRIRTVRTARRKGTNFEAVLLA
jgi:hypothetical protein